MGSNGLLPIWMIPFGPYFTIYITQRKTLCSPNGTLNQRKWLIVSLHIKGFSFGGLRISKKGLRICFGGQKGKNMAFNDILDPICTVFTVISFLLDAETTVTLCTVVFNTKQQSFDRGFSRSHYEQFYTFPTVQLPRSFSILFNTLWTLASTVQISTIQPHFDHVCYGFFS